MSGEIQLTIIGNMVADAELRFTPSGAAVSNFSVACTPRLYKNGDWVDGETTFLRVAAWKELGENVAETLTKGMRVIVTGRLKQRSYETKDGEKRTIIEMEADEVGPSLKYATAKVNRVTRGKENRHEAAASGRDNSDWGDPWGDGSTEPPF